MSDETSKKSESAQTAAATITTLAQLDEQQKVLAEQIAALTPGFLKRAHTKAAVLSLEEIGVSNVSKEGPSFTAKSNSYNDISACVISELKPSSSHFKIEVNLGVEPVMPP